MHTPARDDRAATGECPCRRFGSSAARYAVVRDDGAPVCAAYALFFVASKRTGLSLFVAAVRVTDRKCARRLSYLNLGRDLGIHERGTTVRIDDLARDP